MPTIKFSHQNYLKFPFELAEGIMEMAILQQVFICDLKDLSNEFIGYDTAYIEDGKEFQYKLPKGKLIVLLFAYLGDESTAQLFTTVRKWTPQKEKYYRSQQGKEFEIVLTKEGDH